MTRQELFETYNEEEQLRFVLGAAAYGIYTEDGTRPLQAEAAAMLETIDLESIVFFLLELQAVGIQDNAAADETTLQSCSSVLSTRHNFPSAAESWEKFKAAAPELFS